MGGSAAVALFTTLVSATEARKGRKQAAGAAQKREAEARRQEEAEKTKEIQAAGAIKKRRGAVREDLTRPDIATGRLGITSRPQTADKKLLGV